MVNERGPHGYGTHNKAGCSLPSQQMKPNGLRRRTLANRPGSITKSSPERGIEGSVEMFLLWGRG